MKSLFTGIKDLSTMITIQESGITTVEKENLIQTVVKHISSYCKEDKNLMISVFDIKKNKFLYCNDCFNSILGYKAEEIIRGGWEFWYKKMKPEEAGLIRNKINLLLGKSYSGKHRNEFSFTYHIKDIFDKWYFVSHELSLFYFKKNIFVLNYLHDISQIECIEYFFGKTQNPVNKNGNSIAISKREKEVLMLIADGFSSKQIADELYISNHTAIKHRKNLIEKFKVKNTAQLIKEASGFFQF